MRSRILRPLTLGPLLLAMAATGSGAPAPSQGSFRLDFKAGRPSLEPADGGRFVVPRIAGFGFVQSPGAPMLPLKRYLVAIPAGSVPTLRVLEASAEPLGRLEVAPVPRLRVEERIEAARGAARRGAAGSRAGKGSFQEYDLEFTPGPAYSEGASATAPVRLGRTGYLREQRYVEVLYSPVTFDAQSGRAAFHPEVRAEVVFDLPADGGPAATRPFRPDPLFEDLYRSSLQNYEQGRLFRVGPGEATAEETLATDSAAAPSSEASAALATCAPTWTAPVPPPPPGGGYKIFVSRPGIYRLDYAWLQANAPEFLTADPRALALSAEGVEVPITIRAAAGPSGPLAPGDYLEFYGRPKGGPPALCNYDFSDPFPDIFQANDYTDTEVYWLTAAGAPGAHARIPSVSGAPVNGFAAAADFQETAVWEENNLYLPLGDVEPYFSIPSLLASSTQSARDLSLPLPGIAPVASTAGVTVRLRGGSDLAVAGDDHRTRVWINNDTAGGLDFTWEGEIIEERSFDEPQSVLSNPTTIHFDAPGLPGVSLDKQYVDTVTIRYRRRFTAAGDLLTFTYPNQDARFQVGGFTGAVPVIYEITRGLPGSLEADPVLITGASVSGSPTSTYTFEVPRDPDPSAPAERTFVVAGPAAIRQPDGAVRFGGAVLRDPSLAGDIVVVGTRGTLDPPLPELDDLLDYRASAQGLTSRVVFIDQIYDEFSYGLQDPNSIRAFLSYAFDNWKGAAGTARPPSFVILVGDATSDYKNTLAWPGWVQQVPSQIMFARNSIFGYYASDNWIASFRGSDQLPDVLLGRISARTRAEAAGVFAKILSYEQSPPPGLWKGHMVLVAGDDKFQGNGDNVLFETISNRIASTYFDSAPYTLPNPPLYFQEPPWDAADAAGFRNDLIDELNAGAAVMTFIGHGSFETFGANTFFTTDDARALANGRPIPFMVNVNCLAGGFNDINEIGSVGEGMTNNPNGGAIATLAPAGLSIFAIGDVATDSLFGPLFGKARERLLGTATLAFRTALWSQNSIVDLQSYTFLGDPATRLATPAPPPPAGLAATAGNGQVTLSWAAAPQPVSGYRIYRATHPAGPYAPIACDPLTSTSCADRTVINATRYYYYAVSFDGEGFEGRWSNFNEDCDAGPGCVTARPLNPNPPAAPAGLAAADAGIGGTLGISWAPNPETDIRSYTLYYRAQIGPDPPPLKVTFPAAPTSTLLGGLADGVRYYMVMTATNTSGVEGPPSPEVSGVPHLIQGIAPPRAITDLTLSVSGADLVLRWSQPTVDIYGRPTTVASYRIYASSAIAFVPSPATLIGTRTGGTSTTFTHAGAAVAPGNLFYLVTAVDTNGFVSGAGRDLPNGIQSLALSLVSANPLVVRLTWPAITTDIQGYASLIDHYQVHRTAGAVGRGSLDSSTIFRDNVRSLSVDLDLTGLAGPSFISVIAVDDRGNLSPF